jgi:hypothetical protein
MDRDVRFRFRINAPTIALFLEEGREVARTIPGGAEITVSAENVLQENKLIEVQWAEKRVRMFAQDIRARGEKVE